MTPPRPPGRRECPICRRPPAAKFHPFCSARCADEDLRRWLAGAYRLPAAATDDDDGPATPNDSGQ